MPQRFNDNNSGADIFLLTIDSLLFCKLSLCPGTSRPHCPKLGDEEIFGPKKTLLVPRDNVFDLELVFDSDSAIKTKNLMNKSLYHTISYDFYRFH